MKNVIIRLLLLIVIGSVPSALMAQYPNVQVSLPASISPEEITISINPVDPLNIAAAANIDYYYYSVDGGLNWVEGHMASSLGVAGDPCVCFDAKGEFIQTILHEERSAGPNVANWNPRGLSSGVYFYKVTAGNFSAVKKCVIIK